MPENFLSNADPKSSDEEKDLADFLGGLKVTAKECTPRYGKPYPCENQGKTIHEFSFLNADETFLLDYYKKKPAQYAAIMEDYIGTEAEKIMRNYTLAENIGSASVMEILQRVIDELNEAGVEMEV